MGPRMHNSIVLVADPSCAGGVACRSHTGSMRRAHDFLRLIGTVSLLASRSSPTAA
jgi:hypothetical protein